MAAAAATGRERGRQAAPLQRLAGAAGPAVDRSAAAWVGSSCVAEQGAEKWRE